MCFIFAVPPHLLLKFIDIKKNTTQQKYQTKRHPIRTSFFFFQTTLNLPPHTDNSSSTKVLFHLSTYDRSLQTPTTHWNHPKTRTPRASPDAPVEQKTIQKRGRPPYEPAENGKSRATDEKRLAKIPTTKESGSA